MDVDMWRCGSKAETRNKEDKKGRSQKRKTQKPSQRDLVGLRKVRKVQKIIIKCNAYGCLYSRWIQNLECIYCYISSNAFTTSRGFQCRGVCGSSAPLYSPSRPQDINGIHLARSEAIIIAVNGMRVRDSRYKFCHVPLS